jgi:hypothetical protein
MGDEEHDEKFNFQVGDIVRESVLIIPPGRDTWSGIVVFIDKNYYELFSFIGPTEDLVGVHWLQAGYVESLPASVLRLVQKAKRKTEKNS